MEKKKCNVCGIKKPITEFYTNGTNKRRPECKKCTLKRKNERNKSVKNIIKIRARSILKRLNNTDKTRNKVYKNLECSIGDDVEEIYHYLLNNFKQDFEELINQGKTPSVDRINSNIGYHKGNIQIISFKENTEKGRKKAVQSTSKPIKVIYSDDTEEIFRSVSACARKLNIKRGTIIRNRDNGTTSRKGRKFIPVR